MTAIAVLVGLVLIVYVAKVLFGQWKPGQRQVCWLHGYDTIRDTGVTVYEQCRFCGARHIFRRGRKWLGPPGLVQPIDRKWLATGEWTVMRPPGKNGRRVATKPTMDD